MQQTNCAEKFYKENNRALIKLLASWGVQERFIEDIVQEFYTKIISRDLLAAYDPSRGPFESYVITILKSVLSTFFTQQAKEKRTATNATHTVAVAEQVIDFQIYLSKQEHGIILQQELYRRTIGGNKRKTWPVHLYNQARAQYLEL